MKRVLSALMTLKFTVHGIEVTANDAAEAAALIRELASPSINSSASNTSPPTREPIRRIKLEGRTTGSPRPIAKDGFDVALATFRFLSKLQTDEMIGKEANEFLMDVLQSAHPKGIGVKLGRVNKYIRNIGFDPDHVYENPRTAEGRIWRGKSKLDAAREAIRRAIEVK